MSLWDEGLNQFLDDLRRRKVDERTIREFREERSSPEDARQTCRILQTDVDRKYSDPEVADRKMGKWVSGLMNNIDRFVMIGDIAMKGAPETVGLAWFAVKSVLNGIQNNYKLYMFFSGAVTTITEMMVLIRTYDKLYDERRKPGAKASDISSELFGQIRNVYAGILDFSYSVKKHVKGSKLAKIGHAFKEVFGAEDQEFRAKIDSILAMKANILEYSQAIFQEKTFDSFGDVKQALSIVTETVQSSLASQQEMLDMQARIKESQEKMRVTQDLVLQEVREIGKTTKRPSRLEYAKSDFEKHKKVLDPLPSSSSIFDKMFFQKLDGTCDWFFDSENYQQWWSSPTSEFMYIRGEEGSGKSILVASMIDKLSSQATANDCVQYFSCELDTNADKIESTLIYQLYETATSTTEDPVFLEECNKVFQNPKQGRQNRAGKTMQKSDGNKEAKEALPDLEDAFASLLNITKKRLVLIIDATERVSTSQQNDFFDKVKAVIENSEIDIRLAVACRPRGPLYDRLLDADYRSINLDNTNRDDIEKYLQTSLEGMPGLTQPERDLAKSTILEKAGPSFKYVTQVALPHLQKPWRRPLQKWLEQLPGSFSDTYNQVLTQMAPNYIDLLRTTLSWTLLANRLLTVIEVMDVYMGTFQDENSPEISGDDGSEDVELSRKQIMDAGGPFLDVEREGKDWVVKLKDPTAVRHFCLHSTDNVKTEDDHGHEVCAKCKSELSPSKSLSISEKTGHLQIAITLLKHLNNGIFRRRYLKPAQDETEDKTEPQPETESKAQDGDENPEKSTTEAAEAKDDDMVIVNGESHEDDKPENARDSEGQPIATEQETKPENSTQEGNTKDTSSNAEKQEKEDPDESQDSEDRGEYELREGQLEDEEAEETALSRYEIENWFYHLRQAEKLWTPEERKNEPLWAELFQEADMFFDETSGAHNDWRLVQFNYGGKTFDPLHTVSLYGLVSLAERLLDQGADVMALCPPETGGTPLGLACEVEDGLDIQKLLLSKGADPNFETEKSEIAPFHALIVYHCEAESVKEFLQRGASCNLKTTGSVSALHYFGWCGQNPAILDMLLDPELPKERRGSLACRDDAGETPLHKLMCRFSIPIELLKAFVDKGADVNAEDNDSERPLFEAAYFGEIEAMKILLESQTDEDVDDRNKYGRSALHEAAWQGKKEVVELLTSRKIDINCVDLHDRTPLFFACLGKDEPTVEFILDKLIESGYTIEAINKTTKRGRTPLRQASAKGLAATVDKLLSLNMPEEMINARDNRKGRNALHCASFRGKSEVIEKLLSNGADISIRDGLNGDGKTALELCCDRWRVMGYAEYEATILLLIEKDPTAAALDTRLHAVAALNGSKVTLERLMDLDKTVDFNKPDEYGWTPLLLAKQLQHTDTFEFLSKKVPQTGTRPTRWVREHETLTISEDGLSMDHDGMARVCVFADQPIPPGLDEYYFEVEIFEREGEEGTRTPEFAVGLTNTPHDEMEFPGWPVLGVPTLKSWAMHGDNGGFYTSTRYENIGEHEAYGRGDKIGCGINFEKEILYFTKNGEKIEEPQFRGVKGRLFPVIGFSDNDSMKVSMKTNFGNNLEPGNTTPKPTPEVEKDDGKKAPQ